MCIKKHIEVDGRKKMKGRERASERGRAGERQVESIVAVATSPIYGAWGYHIAKVRLCRGAGIVL